MTPFADARTNENNNRFLMYLIPLVPFGWADFQTPEGGQQHLTSGLWLWRPNEDLAKATAEELNASRIFKEVFFSNRATDGDLVLLGTIHSTRYRASLYSYGLSAYGAYLWIIAFPVGKAKNELELTFTLKDSRSGETLWDRTYREEQAQTSILYNLRPDFMYPDLLKKILMKVVQDLGAETPSLKAKLQPPKIPAKPEPVDVPKPEPASEAEQPPQPEK